MIDFTFSSGATPVHRMNPVVKAVWLVCIVLAALVVEHPLVLMLIFVATVPPVLAAGIVKQWAVFIRLALALGIAVVFINTLAGSAGSQVLWDTGVKLPLAGSVRITLEALVYSLSMVVRLLAVISAFSVFTLTVNPDDILVMMLKFRLPQKIAMLMTLSLRFVPVLLQDAVRIGDSQKSRGLDYNSGNLPVRIKKRSVLLLALLESSLERTVQIAESMEARAFGSTRQRTSYNNTALDKTDIGLLVILLFAFTLTVLCLFTGEFSFSYYPALGNFGISAQGWAVALVAAGIFGGLFLMPGGKEKI